MPNFLITNTIALLNPLKKVFKGRKEKEGTSTDNIARNRARSPPLSLLPESGLWQKNRAKAWTHFTESFGTKVPTETKQNLKKLTFVN